jgi:hypothetical protein
LNITNRATVGRASTVDALEYARIQRVPDRVVAGDLVEFEAEAGSSIA